MPAPRYARAAIAAPRGVLHERDVREVRRDVRNHTKAQGVADPDDVLL